MIKVEERQKYNLLCLEKLREVILTYPQLRFTQILYNMDLCRDRFYEEPDVTLKSLQ